MLCFEALAPGRDHKGGKRHVVLPGCRMAGYAPQKAEIEYFQFSAKPNQLQYVDSPSAPPIYVYEI